MMTRAVPIGLLFYLFVSISLQFAGAPLWAATATAVVFQLLFQLFAAEIAFEEGFYKLSKWLDAPFFTWGKK